MHDKTLDLGHQKINMHVSKLLHVDYLENAELTECRTCRYARYKPRSGRRRTLVTHTKLGYFSTKHGLIVFELIY
jgi:hypothetical protein